MSVIKYTSFLKIVFEKALRTAFSDASVPPEYRYVADEKDPNCKLRIYREMPRRDYNPPVIVVASTAGNASLRYLGEEIVKEVYQVNEEVVVSDTLALIPLQIKTVVGVDSHGVTVPTVENVNFTVAMTTGIFTWLTAKPASYTCTYTTWTNQANYSVPAGKWVQSQVQIPIRIAIYASSNTDRERITDLVVLYLRHVFRPILKPYVTYAKILVGGEAQIEWKSQTVYNNDITIDCWSHYAHYIDQSMYALINNINIEEIDVIE